MNREFIVQLIRNVGLYEDYLFHAKDSDLKKLQEFTVFLEKSLNKFPRKENSFKEKFNGIEQTIQILCPIKYKYFFVLLEGPEIEKGLLLSSNLTPVETVSFIKELSELSL
jgi:hypothetical protein